MTETMQDTALRPDDIEFVFIAESGPLEFQALMLAESLRTFGGGLAGARSTVISPRSSRRPLPDTLKAFERLDVEYVPMDIESAFPEYGPSYKVHAMAQAARRSGAAIMVQVDSDTIFLDEPRLLAATKAATARPVDVKGMCTTSAGDALDPYWRSICQAVSVDYDAIPTVRTTIGGIEVKASYNGGLIAARRDSGVFETTDDFFRKIIQAGPGPFTGTGLRVVSGTEVASEAGSAYWATCQAAFSLAAVKLGVEVAILPERYNFPLHLYDAEAPALAASPVHIHYHWLASGKTGNVEAMCDSRLGLSDEASTWLRARLPLPE